MASRIPFNPSPPVMLLQMFVKNPVTLFQAVSIAERAVLKGEEIFSHSPANVPSPVIAVQMPEKKPLMPSQMFCTAIFALVKIPLKKLITLEKMV